MADKENAQIQEAQPHRNADGVILGADFVGGKYDFYKPMKVPAGSKKGDMVAVSKTVVNAETFESENKAWGPYEICSDPWEPTQGAIFNLAFCKKVAGDRSAAVANAARAELEATKAQNAALLAAQAKQQEELAAIREMLADLKKAK